MSVKITIRLGPIVGRTRQRYREDLTVLMLARYIRETVENLIEAEGKLKLHGPGHPVVGFRLTPAIPGHYSHQPTSGAK